MFVRVHGFNIVTHVLNPFRIKERVLAEIVFTGNYSLESKFFLYNVTKLMVTLVVYGYEQYNVPSDFQPILVPQFLITEDDDTPKFGVGKNFIDPLCLVPMRAYNMCIIYVGGT